MTATMTEKRKRPKQQEASQDPKPAKRYPSRDKYKYVILPVELHSQLEAIGRQEERKVPYYVRLAVREWLARRKGPHQSPH